MTRSFAIHAGRWIYVRFHWKDVELNLSEKIGKSQYAALNNSHHNLPVALLGVLNFPLFSLIRFTPFRSLALLEIEEARRRDATCPPRLCPPSSCPTESKGKMQKIKSHAVNTSMQPVQKRSEKLPGRILFAFRA
jgi:hypothetical protein